MGKLNVKRVQAAGAGRHFDGKGLFLQVTPGGSKTWLYRFTLNGRTREMGLGPFPFVSLLQARKAAEAAKDLCRQGIDPIEARRDEKRAVEAQLAATRTFRQVAEQYLADHRGGWSEKYASQWENGMRDHAYPILGDMDVRAITTEHVLRVLRPIWSTKITGTRTRNRLEIVLDAAAASGARDPESPNPARWRGHLAFLLPRSRAKVAHHPAMAYDELPAFVVTLKARGDIPSMALRFLILTACRSNEVLGAKWGEIDREARIWTVPEARMKGRRAHRVPLSRCRARRAQRA